jgi:hypothetical protein
MTKEQIDKENWRRFLDSFPTYLRPDLNDKERCWSWQKSYFKRREGKVEPTGYFRNPQGKVQQYYVNRFIYELYHQISLPPEIWLVRIDPCITDFCVSPHHFRRMTSAEFQEERNYPVLRIQKLWESNRKAFLQEERTRIAILPQVMQDMALEASSPPDEDEAAFLKRMKEQSQDEE